MTDDLPCHFTSIFKEKSPPSQHRSICEHFFAYSSWRHLVRIQQRNNWKDVCPPSEHKENPSQPGARTPSVHAALSGAPAARELQWWQAHHLSEVQPPGAAQRSSLCPQHPQDQLA
ncbi:uncharacterized protein LOC144222843 [Crocuta crocuta]